MNKLDKLDELVRLVEIDKENCEKIVQYNDEIYKVFYKLASGFTFSKPNSTIGQIKDADQNIFLTIDFESGKILNFEINAMGAVIDIIEKNIKTKFDKNHEDLIQLAELKKSLNWEK